MNAALKKRILNIKLLVFDVDGVLTDGRIVLGGVDELKFFDVKDGAGIALAQRAGLRVAFLTARTSECVARRGKELKVANVIQGAKDKVAALESLAKKSKLTLEEISYMGDDLPDLAVLRCAGITAAPADAVAEVRAFVDIVTKASGGRGAVREFCEVVLRIQKKWDALVESYGAKSTALRQ